MLRTDEGRAVFQIRSIRGPGSRPWSSARALACVGVGTFCTTLTLYVLGTGCGPQLPPSPIPPISERLDVQTRFIAYEQPYPELGRCVDVAPDGTPLVNSELCVPGAAPISSLKSAVVLPPDRGNFRFQTILLGTTASGSGSVSVASVEAGVSTTRFRLVMEWSRFQTFQLWENVDASVPSVAKSYVSGVDIGIGILVTFDVRLNSASISAAASFGFGNLAVAVANNQASVDVRYDTIGLKQDILPPSAPTSVSSVSDLAAVENALFTAIKSASDSWNAALDAASPDASFAARFNYEPIAYSVTWAYGDWVQINNINTIKLLGADASAGTDGEPPAPPVTHSVRQATSTAALDGSANLSAMLTLSAVDAGPSTGKKCETHAQYDACVKTCNAYCLGKQCAATAGCKSEWCGGGTKRTACLKACEDGKTKATNANCFGP